jgi:hypothetical protein
MALGILSCFLIFLLSTNERLRDPTLNPSAILIDTAYLTFGVISNLYLFAWARDTSEIP